MKQKELKTPLEAMTADQLHRGIMRWLNGGPTDEAKDAAVAKAVAKATEKAARKKIEKR